MPSEDEEVLGWISQHASTDLNPPRFQSQFAERLFVNVEDPRSCDECDRDMPLDAGGRRYCPLCEMREYITGRLRDSIFGFRVVSVDPVGSHGNSVEVAFVQAASQRLSLNFSSPSHSPDAMSMNFDLVPTDICWKKVSGLECGEPSDPESETGMCAAHKAEVKAKYDVVSSRRSKRPF